MDERRIEGAGEVEERRIEGAGEVEEGRGDKRGVDLLITGDCD